MPFTVAAVELRAANVSQCASRAAAAAVGVHCPFASAAVAVHARGRCSGDILMAFRKRRKMG